VTTRARSLADAFLAGALLAGFDSAEAHKEAASYALRFALRPTHEIKSEDLDELRDIAASFDDSNPDTAEWICGFADRLSMAIFTPQSVSPNPDTREVLGREGSVCIEECGCPLPAMVRDDGTCSGCGSQVVQLDQKGGEDRG
jgi:hypothetical protein